jgi:hypothetical protein
VPTEAVDFVLHRILKTPHNQEGDNSRSQTNANAGHRNFVDGCGKTLTGLFADALGYEVREVQLWDK